MTEYIQIDQRDNVAVAVLSEGIRKGSVMTVGGDTITAGEDIPQGHKIAVRDIAPNAPIIRYGAVIGCAREKISRGQWVSETLVAMPDPPDLNSLVLPDSPCASGMEQDDRDLLDGYTFEGFRNDDGTVGTRNILGIAASVQCVAGVVDHVVRRIKTELLPRYPNVDDVIPIVHNYGCGVAINAPAAVIPIRTLQNIVRNPNLGNEVLVIGLGCEKLDPDRLLPSSDTVECTECPNSARYDSESRIILQDKALHGFNAMVGAIMNAAEKHLCRLNQRKRTCCPVSDLTVGVQCGGSDAFSGITANPAVGYAADMIVRAGGTVIFSEVTEVRDAAANLAERAVDQEVLDAIKRELAWYDNYLTKGGADRSANTSPGNKTGGLSNIVEKALGSVVKSGSMPIVDVLGPGERLRKKGLVFAATPASDFICGTLQLAAGINMQVFTTGRGTPYGLAMVPVIKLSTTTGLARRWHDLIDLDAGRIATGEQSIAEAGRELFELILAIAGGNKQCAADRLGLHNPLALFDPGPAT